MTYWNALTRAQRILIACLFLFPIAAGAAEPFAEIETLINGGFYRALELTPDYKEAKAALAEFGVADTTPAQTSR